MVLPEAPGFSFVIRLVWVKPPRALFFGARSLTIVFFFLAPLFARELFFFAMLGLLGARTLRPCLMGVKATERDM